MNIFLLDIEDEVLCEVTKVSFYQVELRTILNKEKGLFPIYKGFIKNTEENKEEYKEGEKIKCIVIGFTDKGIQFNKVR